MIRLQPLSPDDTTFASQFYRYRLLLALIMPFAATALQQSLLQFIPQTTWLLLYPAVFFSAWLAGLAGGIVSTLLAALLGWYIFLPPYGSWGLEDSRHGYSIAIFMVMGGLFSVFFERLKRSQQALNKAIADRHHTDQARLTQALTLSNAGFWEWDLRSDRIYWSDTLHSLYGLDVSTSPTHDNWLQGVHEDDRVSVMTRLKTLLSQEQEINLEWRVANLPVGQTRWLFTNGQPLRDGQGKIIFYRGIVLDITERKKQETQLQEKQQRLDFALDTLRAGSWTLDFQTHVMQHTALHDQIFGYIQAQPAWSFERFVEHVVPEDRASVIECFHQALKSQGDWQFECQIKKADGDTAWIYTRGRLKFDAIGQAVSMAGIVQDITQRKQVEQQKLYAETLYRTLVDQAAPDSVYIHDHQGRFLEVNQRACEHDGYSKAELLSLSVMDVEVDFDLTSAQAAWLKIEPGVVTTLLGHHHRKDGSVYPVEIRVGLLESNQQRLYIVFARDITERIQAEQALAYDLKLQHEAEMKLKASEARWQFALEGSNQGVWDWDIANGKVFYSSRLKAMLGFKDDEFSDNLDEWASRVHPDELPAVMSEVEKHFNQETPFYHNEHRLKNSAGEYQWILDSGKVVERDSNGKPLRMIGTHQDISARKQIEQDLAKSERRFQDIVSVSADWIWELDADARYTYVSDSVQRALGFSPDTIIGKTPFDLMPPEAANEQLDAYKRIISECRPFRDLENINVHRDGSLHVMQTSGMPIIDDQGNILGYRGLDRDITLKKIQDEQLVLYRDHLENLVFDRTQELHAALAQAEHLAKVKSDFLANMSHEIRTPLNAVLGFCYLLQQKSLQADSLALVGKIHTAGRSLLAIINDILDFSKIEAGRLEVELEPFSLSNLLDDLVALVSSLAGNKQLKLIVTPSPDIDALIGDGRRLQQVLLNLLCNAVKFTEFGEIELRVSVETDNGKQLNVKFSVRDTGIGISPEKQQEIFQAFTQADSTISRRFGGSGLGLAISRQLVELMGGELEVQSIEGQGSQFWFTLPLKRDMRSVSRVQLNHLTFLVADENETTRLSLSNTLGSLGWKADIVDSGEKAFAHYLASWEIHKPYDVIVLDRQLPERNGLYTAQLIRNVSVNSQHSVPILLMVNASDRDDLLAQPGIECVDRVITKPATASMLFNSIFDVLNHRKQSPGIQSLSLHTEIEQRIQGLRILVVDDSEINREVAKSILENEGALVSLADDGQQALVWLQQHPDAVDIVLMDVQMPIMDGYTATQKIRQDQRLSKLPVIALTAGAFQSLRDAAFNAGMDDFVAKPFDVGQIITVIKRHTQHTVVSEPKPEKTTAEALLHLDTAELPGIDVNVGLKQWGQLPVYLKFLNKFVDQYADAGNDIANFMRNHDRKSAAALTHKLKGVAGNLALDEVMHQVKLVENALLNKQATPTDAENLQHSIDQACSSINILQKRFFPVK